MKLKATDTYLTTAVSEVFFSSQNEYPAFYDAHQSELGGWEGVVTYVVDVAAVFERFWNHVDDFLRVSDNPDLQKTLGYYISGVFLDAQASGRVPGALELSHCMLAALGKATRLPDEA